MKHNNFSFKKITLSVSFSVVFLVRCLLGFASGVKKGFPYTWA